MLLSSAVIGLQGRAKVSNLSDTGPSTKPTPEAAMAGIWGLRRQGTALGGFAAASNRRAGTKCSFGVFVYRGQVAPTRDFFHFHPHPPQIADAVRIHSADDGLLLT